MSLPNEQPGHGQMSCNPEAHDYAGFANTPPSQRPSPASATEGLSLDALMSVPMDQLRQRYYESVQRCTMAEQQRVELDAPPITADDPPHLVLASQLYQAWQIKALPFRSVQGVR